MKLLIESGMPSDKLVELLQSLREDEEAALPVARRTSAERTARWRERRASQGVTERHKASPSVTDPVLSRQEVSPAPLQETQLSDPTPFTPLKGGVSPAPRHAKPTAEEVETIWALQPVINDRRRSTRPDVARALEAAMRRGAAFAEIAASCGGYYAIGESQRDGGQFAMGAHRLLERDRWRDFGPKAPEAPSWDHDHWRAAVKMFAETGRWSEAWGPSPNLAGCLAPPEILKEYRPPPTGNVVSLSGDLRASA